uniref:C2H2-type domain-containing protein n=1 Tax=viral metagenome TaxID=1070528 RepID=A0A6C0I3M5_9ZZZZ
MYTCDHCDKTYRYKKNLETHETVCKFMHLPLQQRNEVIDVADDPIPTMKELFHIIRQQSLRIDKLESNHKKLKMIQNRKMDILHWLQQGKDLPTMTFQEWIASLIARVPTYINIALKENLNVAMTQLFAASLENMEHLPICVFDNKPSQYYIFRTASWEQLTLHEFDHVLQKIAEQFYNVFVSGWYKENEAQLLKSETLYNQFIGYQQNVLATLNYGHLRQFIYSKIKRVIGTVTEIVIA